LINNESLYVVRYQGSLLQLYLHSFPTRRSSDLVINERCRLNQALIQDKRFESLSLLPAAQTSDKSAVTKEGMLKIVSELRDDYDYIIIDCPAGIEQGFENAVVAADKAIVVTT